MSRKDRKRVGVAMQKPLEGANLNGRIYPPGLREKALAEYQERVARGEVVGTLGVGGPPAFRVAAAQLFNEGEGVTLVPLDNPAGRRLAELLKGAGPVSMGVRGTLTEEGEFTPEAVNLVPAPER